MDGRIDLERARRDAKALLRAARDGEVVLRTDRAPALAEAQRAVAAELGYSSWPALVAGVRGSALLAAAEAGRASEVYRLLVEGAPANARDDAGRTALHLAAAGGFVDVVDVLVGWVPVDRAAVDDSGRVAWSDDPVVARILAPREAPAEDAALGELAWRADAALFSLIAGSPVASRRTVGDGFAFRTGLFDNTRNGVVCSRAEDVDDAIAWLGGAPAQWLIGANSALGPALERVGCRPERTAVFMARESDAASVRDAAASRAAAAAADDTAGSDAAAASDDAAAVRDDAATRQIAAIRDAATLRAAMAAVDELQFDVREAELLASLGFDGPLRHYAMLSDGAPVGLVSTFSSAGSLTITNLAVAPEWRRRGLGRALLRHVSSELTLLDPTPATVPFYEALGFDGPLRHFAVLRDGAPVGLVSTFSSARSLTITNLAVAPEWRRQGLGRALVRHVSSGLTLLGPTPATVPFYEALGFRLLRYPADRTFYLPV